jgi:hypothetical protein
VDLWRHHRERSQIGSNDTSDRDDWVMREDPAPDTEARERDQKQIRLGHAPLAVPDRQHKDEAGQNPPAWRS